MKLRITLIFLFFPDRQGSYFTYASQLLPIDNVGVHQSNTLAVISLQSINLSLIDRDLISPTIHIVTPSDEYILINSLDECVEVELYALREVMMQLLRFV
jgi:hypothetical protein